MTAHNLFPATPLITSLLVALIAGCSFPNKTATSAAAMASGNFSSGETLEVLRAINNGEISQAELAKDKADNDEVEDVAESIIDDHRELNQRVDDLVERGIDTEKSPLSRGLTKQSEQIQERLATLGGTDFDCTYLNKQVEQHQLALETIRNQVQPDVNDPQIQELVKDAIAALEDHREAAAKARADIEACS